MNSKYEKFFYLLIFIFLQGYILASPKFESDFPIHSSGSLNFDVDVCQFDGPGDSTIVEIYYSVFLTKESSDQIQNDNITILSVELQILNENGNLLVDINENKTVSLFDSLNPSKYTTYYDLKTFKILPGKVVINSTIQESQTLTQGQVSQSFRVRKFENLFSLSDLYFVSHVQRSSGPHLFNKSGLMMVPNPSRVYFVQGDAPRIFIYYEINNLTYNKDNPSLYEISHHVKDISGNEISTNPRKQLPVTAKNTSRIEAIPIKNYKTGIYYLVVEAIDIASGLKQETMGYFQVDRGERKKVQILPMSKEEEKKYLSQIKHIASKKEIKLFKKLDSRSKQEFILRFWKSKDTDKSTPQNEFMIDHFRRLAFVEKEFKGGTDSDMGRVYIKYGPPVDIERENSMAASAQAVQIWSYAVDGRTDFVFVDRDGDGKFVLVHSTHRDEYSNPGWQDGLQ